MSFPLAFWPSWPRFAVATRTVLRLAGVLLLAVGCSPALAAEPATTSESAAASDLATPTPYVAADTSPRKPRTKASPGKFFDSAGVRIHYVEQGQGDPVLLIHGFSASIPTQWASPGILAALSQKYRVIALDNRGHGKSDKPHDPAQYGAAMVADAVRLLDHLHVPKAHVVGYSMGGFITLKLLATRPQRCATAAICGSGWIANSASEDSFREELATSLETGQGVSPLIRRLTPKDRPAPSDEQLKTLNQMFTLINDPQALAAVIRGMNGLAITEEQLREIRVPAIAIIGEADTLRERLDETVAVWKDLPVVLIPGADHMNAFRSQLFLSALIEFLQEHPLSGS